MSSSLKICSWALSQFFEHPITHFQLKCMLGLSQIENVSHSKIVIGSLYASKVDSVFYLRGWPLKSMSSPLWIWWKIFTIISEIIPHALYRCIQLPMASQPSNTPEGDGEWRMQIRIWGYQVGNWRLFIIMVHEPCRAYLYNHRFTWLGYQWAFPTSR